MLALQLMLLLVVLQLFELTLLLELVVVQKEQPAWLLVEVPWLRKSPQGRWARLQRPVCRPSRKTMSWRQVALDAIDVPPHLVPTTGLERSTRPHKVVRAGAATATPDT